MNLLIPSGVPNRVKFRPRYGMGYTEPPDCTPPPGAIPNPGCIAQLLAVQQANMAEQNATEEQTFLDNCNRDWATNDAQYAALGLPRPANTCAERDFGITPTGGPSGGYTGSPVQAQIPVTYIQPTTNAPPLPSPQPDPVIVAQQAANTAAAAAKQAAADPTNPAAQATAAQAQADAAAAAKLAQNTTLPVDNTLYWIAGAAAAGLLLFAAVNR